MNFGKERRTEGKKYGSLITQIRHGKQQKTQIVHRTTLTYKQAN